MVLRARFETVEDQRQFFNNVKNKLGIGSTKLARLINVPNRLRMDWWSMCKCSPPVWVVNELSKISDVNPPKFDQINGIVIRKRRRMPSGFKKRYIVMNEKCANKVLVSKFGKWKQKIDEMIMKDLRTTDILKQLRKNGYSFNTGKISTAVNSLIKSKELRIVDKIDGNGCVIVRGNVFLGKKSFILSFCSQILAQKIKNKKVRIGIEFDKGYNSVRVYALHIGRCMSTGSTKGHVIIGLPKVLPLKGGDKLDVYIKPTEFGLTCSDFIRDKDGRLLGKVAERLGIKIIQKQDRVKDGKVDLILDVCGKEVVIEISRASACNISRFKLGQCIVQLIAYPNSTHFIVVEKNLFSEIELKALEYIKTNVIFTDFKINWERKVIDEIVRTMQRLRHGRNTS